jgi:hypothetical protein
MFFLMRHMLHQYLSYHYKLYIIYISIITTIIIIIYTTTCRFNFMKIIINYNLTK